MTVSRTASSALLLPGGWVTRVALLVVAIVLTLPVFLLPETYDLSRPVGWMQLLLPFVPIVAIQFGALAGAAGLGLALLVVVAAVAFGVASSDAEVTLLTATLSVPMMVAASLYGYMLRKRVAVASSAIVGALFLCIAAMHPGGEVPQLVVIDVAILAIVTVAGMGLASYVRRHESESTRIVELEAREARIRGEERMRLAHELHDIVAHDVTIIAMQARRAAVVTDPAKTASIIDGIAASAQQALNDMRSLVLLLKEDAPSAPSRDVLDAPPAPGTIVGTTGLAHDLDAITDALERAGFATTLAIHGELALIPTALRQALRRTARELGTNILKHADPGNPVAIALTVTDSTVTMTTRNTPASGRPVSSSHTGFEAMRARALLLGGTLRSGSSDNTWTTTLTVPLTGRLMTDASRKENE